MIRQQATQLTCNTSINYADVPGDRILPFLIELDLGTSVLNPAPGVNQKFCYNITGVGSDEPEFADLSHIVFGICNQIPSNQIVNISVIINGVAQTVIFGSGGNVELRTPESPDPPTGCPGLKFNFGLNKISGVMNICYELTVPYPVGPNVVCVFGGNVTANELSICGPVCGEVGTCEAIGYQPATVCAPVTVTPFAIPGIATTFCCGDPIITPRSSVCSGTLNGSCTFTMTQRICVAVPVQFGANTYVGDPSVQCDDATSEDVCTNCNDPALLNSTARTAGTAGTCPTCKKN